MQKRILLFVVYVTLTGAAANAQTKKYIAPPPPPASPAPIENVIAAPLPPPVPPTPPEPVEYMSPVIVNNNGYDIYIEKVNGTGTGTGTIFLEKDGAKQKIKLSTWNANRKFYEKKYGQLPPPPPPAAPINEKDEFNRSAIVPDTQ